MAFVGGYVGTMKPSPDILDYLNKSNYTDRVYRGHPGVERSARWCLLCLRVLTRGVWRDDFGIGDLLF